MKWRLLLAMTGLITMVLVAQDVPLAGYLRRMESERLVATKQRDAFILGGASENLLTDEPSAQTLGDLQNTIDLYVAAPENVGARVVIVDADGKLLLSTDKNDLPGEDYTNRPEIVRALDRTPDSGERPSDTTGGDLVYVAVPVLSGADVAGVVRITVPASVIDERADEKARGLLLVFGISLAGAVMAAVFLSASITSPLRRLQRSTEHLAAGDFTERADEVRGPKEIRSLARSFNAMTGRIAGLVTKQRAFAGDASHQLRTPLTALRLQLERAATMVDHDPEGARERIEAASAETERLQRLVEGLLMIARSDGTDPDRVVVDVSAMVRERAEVWGPFADERGVQLATSAHAGLRALAVPDALEQIIDNYLDNALGVAGPGQTITITAFGHYDMIGVQVIDEGPGMKPEHLAQAFDRFWRAPDAPHGGSGIGLAVVQHLAQLSGGRVELANRPDRSGLIASVLLPVAH